ncbi:MAG: apolipoprotein N-acyltransferase, partial [Candidatus Binatia bacterium]
MTSLAWCIAGGLTVAAAFLDFRLWPIGWLAFAAILRGLLGARSFREAAWLGLATGLAINIPAFHWLVGTIHRFGGFPFWLSAAFYGGLSALSSLQLVLFALAVHRTGPGFAAVVPALVWTTLEFSFPNLFPWRMANSQLEVPALMQIGELTGPFGLSFVMVWFSGAVASALRGGLRPAGPALAASVVAAAGVWLFGVVRLPQIERAIAEAPTVRVGIVQGNLTIEEKNDVAYFDSNVETYRRLSEEIADEADVIIWPESVIGDALPRELRRLGPKGIEILGLRKPLLAGAMTYDRQDGRVRLFNTVVLFAPDGSLLGMSDKQILMPFGETMPFGTIFPWLYDLSPQTGNFEAGTGVVPLDVPGVGRFAPLNCYEDLKAAIARDATVRAGGEILFAVANDAWFGDTMAPYQHEALGAWRTVENRRALVRATNTGVTDVIDPAGRVVTRFPVFQP